MQATEDGLDGQSCLIAEQTARAIQAIDVATRAVAEQIESGALRHAGRDALHQYLADHIRGLISPTGLPS